MSATTHALKALRFEPHGGYGTEIDGETFPFGYLSKADRPGQPVFELATVITYSYEELRSYALVAAAGPDMLAVLKALLPFVESVVTDPDDIEGRALALRTRGAIRLAETGERP